MASVVRLVRLVCSAHWSREAAASTDFREQPETPGPQPRQGSKASDVPVMLNSEFSSKFGRRPEVLASLVVLGTLSLDALAELLAGAEAEPVLPLAAVSQPASRQRASAAQSSSETNRFWIMADSSFYQCPARRRGSILGLTSSILFSPAVVNRRSWDEFQLRLTFKAEAVIIGTERESNKNPMDIKPRSIV